MVNEITCEGNSWTWAVKCLQRCSLIGAYFLWCLLAWQRNCDMDKLGWLLHGPLARYGKLRVAQAGKCSRHSRSSISWFGGRYIETVSQHSPLSRGSGLRDCYLFLTGHSKTGIRIRLRALGAWGFIGITGSRGVAGGILERKDVSLK